jgi:hypothetical protein
VVEGIIGEELSEKVIGLIKIEVAEVSSFRSFKTIGVVDLSLLGV